MVRTWGFSMGINWKMAVNPKKLWLKWKKMSTTKDDYRTPFRVTSLDITILIIHPKIMAHLPFNSPVELTSTDTYSQSKPLQTNNQRNKIRKSFDSSAWMSLWAPAGGGTHIVLNPIRQLMSRWEGVQNLCLSRQHFQKKTRPPKAGPTANKWKAASHFKVPENRTNSHKNPI